MKNAGFVVFSTAVALLLSSAAAECQGITKELINQASLIFEGTVEANLGAAAPGQVTTVRIDRVIDKPIAVSISPGQNVMVKMKGPGTIPVGTRVLFYANGRVFGETLTAEEVDHTLLAQGPTAAAVPSNSSAQISQARQEAENDQLRAKLNSASAVVVGRVKEVRLPSGGIAALDQGGRLPVSEHDPQLREAVIEVQDGIKGASAGEDVVVRFPASKDVKWFNFPKLQTGQAGTFILHGDNVSGVATANLAGNTVPAYSVLQPSDVLSTADASKIRGLLK